MKWVAMDISMGRNPGRQVSVILANGGNPDMLSFSAEYKSC